MRTTTGTLWIRGMGAVTIPHAEIRFVGNSVIIRYPEATDQMPNTITTIYILSAAKPTVRVVRDGDVRSDYRFVDQTETHGQIVLPEGIVPIAMKTRSLSIRRESLGIEVVIDALLVLTSDDTPLKIDLVLKWPEDTLTP